MGREAHLLTHGVDLAHWSDVSSREAARCEGLERPLLTFWGLVDRRLDVSWIEELVAGLASGTLLLVGPWNDPDPILRRLPRVELIGEVSYDDLPSIAASTGVLVMPYLDIPATRAMQPLKLKEYLATGRPVVARALPALDAWRDACDVVEGAGAFVERVVERLRTGVPESQVAARARLVAESWDRKSCTFEKLLLGR
jgi:glycosyltransferase involved in cell wall biosynthesis